MTQHIYSALLFLKYNAVAQFVTEINAALDENTVCQKTIMPSTINFTDKERFDLYRAAMRLNVERRDNR